ncbi:MAG TPA: DUF2911 domain-containing protein [Gemmatimonadaceae bacterium]|jgi:hypothetical protein
MRQTFRCTGSDTVRATIIALGIVGCSKTTTPAAPHTFVTRLGNDTIAVETVTRSGNHVTTEAVDRFPRVRKRHTDITLAPDGGIQHLTMDITTPSEPENQRQRHVIADVNKDSIIMTKRDAAAFTRWALADHGETVMAHVPQMYSLYELYFAAALQRMKARGSNGRDTAQLRQFYIDREFDKFGTHHGIVTRLADGKIEIEHDWLAGTGEATIDSAFQLQHYSGARTTYKVDVTRVADSPDIAALATRFAAEEAKGGGAKQLSVRDTVRATIGAAAFTVDYARPLARGRKLLGDIIPFGNVWRTGANAATQFTTTVPITVGTLKLVPATYTLWTLPRADGTVDLIINKQSGQWGTEYDHSRDLGATPLKTEVANPPVEEFTIAIQSGDAHHGTLVIEWGSFRWTVPIVL